MAITVAEYRRLRELLGKVGYGDEYTSSQGVQPPTDGFSFWLEYGLVVVNSGMRNQVAVQIWERIRDAIATGQTVASSFGHPGKAAAIQLVYDQRRAHFEAYVATQDKVEHLGRLPWIGPITKWHLAKNFGIECAKPDRHLARLADAEGVSVADLCSRLAGESGDRIATVDLVLWRAANVGLLDTKGLAS